MGRSKLTLRGGVTRMGRLSGVRETRQIRAAVAPSGNESEPSQDGANSAITNRGGNGNGECRGTRKTDYRRAARSGRGGSDAHGVLRGRPGGGFARPGGIGDGV